MNACCRTLIATLLLSTFGCVGGPDYAGGPTTEQSHGIVDPDMDVSIWRVDGFDTASRNSAIVVEPGLRRIKVRIEFPINREDAVPFEMREIELRVEAGHLYEISRKDPPEEELDLGPPYELLIREYALR